MWARSVSRHVAWVEANLPELAHLGRREVDRVIMLSERGVMTLRAMLFILSLLIAGPAARRLEDSLHMLSDRWASHLTLIVCLLPLLLASVAISDRVWRWRIARAANRLAGKG